MAEEPTQSAQEDRGTPPLRGCTQGNSPGLRGKDSDHIPTPGCASGGLGLSDQNDSYVKLGHESKAASPSLPNPSHRMRKDLEINVHNDGGYMSK